MRQASGRLGVGVALRGVWGFSCRWVQGVVLVGREESLERQISYTSYIYNSCVRSAIGTCLAHLQVTRWQEELHGKTGRQLIGDPGVGARRSSDYRPGDGGRQSGGLLLVIVIVIGFGHLLFFCLLAHFTAWLCNTCSLCHSLSHASD